MARVNVASEKVVLRAVVKRLEACGCRVFRRNTGGVWREYRGRRRYVAYSEPGAADLWGRLPDGRPFECEVKRPGERPRRNQVAWLMKLNGLGSPAFWVDSTVVLDLVLRVLLAGGAVVYLDEIRWYREQGKRVPGYSGNYDLLRG
jgi:hypothetical protein